MATLQEIITKFQSDYGINFDLDKLVNDSRRLNYVEDVLMETNVGNDAGTYKSVLRELLRSYMENKIGIASGKTDFDASNLDLVKFVKDYEEMMAARNEESEKKNPNRKEYEGLRDTILLTGMDVLEAYDKPLTDIWADKVLKGKISFEEFSAFADGESQYVNENYSKPAHDALKSRADNVFLAAKAMEKIWEGRSIFWIIRHPVMAVRDYNYKKTLNDIAQNLFTQKDYTYPQTNVYSYTSMVGHVFDKMKNDAEAKRIAKEQRAEKKAERQKNMSVQKEEEPKITIDMLLQKKAKTWKDSDELRRNESVKEAFKDGIANILGKCTDENAKISLADNAYTTMAHIADTFWDQFNTATDDKKKETMVQERAKSEFERAYKIIDSAPGMSTAEKLVAAQKITNLILVTVTPVASDDKYAPYADNYFLKNVTAETIQNLTGVNENAQDILNEARFELGIDNKLQLNLGDVVNEKQDVNKSEEVKEQELPVKKSVIE